MAEGIPARLTAAEGRKFGLTVGLAFIALGGVALWRGRHLSSTVLFSLGGVLVLAGLLVPTMLGPVERAWMGLGHLMGKVTQPIFMGVVYFVVIAPIGFIRRRFSTAPIGSFPRTESRWVAHEPSVTDAARMERQF
ncbi:MAG: SxtJ family membrane protein [bacterium]